MRKMAKSDLERLSLCLVDSQEMKSLEFKNHFGIMGIPGNKHAKLLNLATN